jgi:hypothetical protein
VRAETDAIYDKGIWQLNGRPIADGAPDVLTVLAFVVTTMDRSGQA